MWCLRLVALLSYFMFVGGMTSAQTPIKLDDGFLQNVLSLALNASLPPDAYADRIMTDLPGAMSVHVQRPVYEVTIVDGTPISAPLGGDITYIANLDMMAVANGQNIEPLQADVAAVCTRYEAEMAQRLREDQTLWLEIGPDIGPNPNEGLLRVLDFSTTNLIRRPLEDSPAFPAEMEAVVTCGFDALLGGVTEDDFATITAFLTAHFSSVSPDPVLADIETLRYAMIAEDGPTGPELWVTSMDVKVMNAYDFGTVLSLLFTVYILRPMT